MVSFAETCADAYINQYIEPKGGKVLENPLVYYNCRTNTFGWTSNQTPLEDQIIVLMQIQKGSFSKLGSDAEITRYLIVDSIMSNPDWHYILDKITITKNLN